MNKETLVTLLERKQYPTRFSNDNRIGELLTRGFDAFVAHPEFWQQWTGPELTADFLAAHSRWDGEGVVPLGQVISSSYQLSVDETADVYNGCNYRSFVTSMMTAWVQGKLPIPEILALLADARAAIDNRHGTAGLHYVH